MQQVVSPPTAQRKTPSPVRTDARAAFALRVLMDTRGLSSQGLADAMYLAGFVDAPARSTIDRIVRENAVPQARHRRALDEFFYGADTAKRIWKTRPTPSA